MLVARGAKRLFALHAIEGERIGCVVLAPRSLAIAAGHYIVGREMHDRRLAVDAKRQRWLVLRTIHLRRQAIR